MIYLIITLLLFLSSAPILSEEERKFITGKIKRDSFPIRDVHIFNITTNKGTVSNDLGMFMLPVKLGDRISISHLNFKNRTISITKNILDAMTVKITLAQQVTLLEAFTLKKTRGIFEQDTDIVKYSGPTVNAKTLKLPYVNTKVSEDGAVLQIQSGVVISLSNLLGVLSGSKKRAKALRKIRMEDTQLVKIRNFFTDDFFITDLQIQKKHINYFLNFCIKKNIIQFFDKKDNLRLTKILLQESNLFLQRNASLITIALKKE
jgi:hypothetical protein